MKIVFLDEYSVCGRSMEALSRFGEYKGYDVNYVSNFTDVDDKIIKKAIEEGVTADEISKRYIAECKKDMEGMNIMPATTHPLATQEIGGMIDMISTLIDKGYAYEKNGTVSRKKVEIGRRLGTEYEILSGVEPGKQVVIAGQNKLADGAAVELVK